MSIHTFSELLPSSQALVGSQALAGFSWGGLWRPRSHTAALRRIVDRVRKSLDLPVVLQTAVDEVATLLQVDRCTFFWYFADTNRVQVVCESDLGGAFDSGTAHSPESRQSRLGYYPIETFAVWESAISRGEMVIHSGENMGNGVAGWLSRWRFMLNRSAPQPKHEWLHAKASLLVPLNTQDGSTGFIACFSDHPRRWTFGETELLQAIAQPLAIAISQAQLYDQMQKQAQRERLVNQITAQTRQSFELSIILKGAIAQLLDALHVDRCLVHLVEEPTEPTQFSLKSTGSIPLNTHPSVSATHLYEVCRPPFPSTLDQFDINGPITQWVIQNRRRVVIANVAADQRIGPDNAEYQQASIKSSLVVPVQTKETLHAILYLNQCSDLRYWSKNDQKLAQAVADQLAISIQQAHFYAHAQQKAAESAAQAKYLSDTLQELRLTQAQLIQSEKMSSLGRVVAGVAHEINNPINFISGNLPYVQSYAQDLIRLLNAYQSRLPEPDAELRSLIEAIELDFLRADLPRILNSMKLGSERVRQIVLSLRNFSRLDEAQCKAVDVHEGLESTLLVLQSYMTDDAIQIVRNYGALPLVECFPRQLNQVFMNVLTNAVESLRRRENPDKAIAISTAFVPASDAQAAFVRIVISDNGIGIPREIQSHIFDPFFTTKEVGQGAGLGLTVSYQTIVSQHQGQLRFYSEPKLGAEFMIEIPVNQSLGTP